MSESLGSKVTFVIKNVILNTADALTDFLTGIQLVRCGEIHWGILLMFYPFWPGFAATIAFVCSVINRKLPWKEGIKYIAYYSMFPIFHLLR